MALLYVGDESHAALWSLCVQVLDDAARPRDVRDACAALAQELLAAGRLTDVERHEREAVGRAIRARRSAVAAPSAWRLARPAGAAAALAGLVEVAAALAGGRWAALVAGGCAALVGVAAVWVAAARAARGSG